MCYLTSIFWYLRFTICFSETRLVCDIYTWGWTTQLLIHTLNNFIFYNYWLTRRVSFTIKGLIIILTKCLKIFLQSYKKSFYLFLLFFISNDIYNWLLVTSLRGGCCSWFGVGNFLPISWLNLHNLKVMILPTLYFLMFHLPPILNDWI